MGASLQKAKLMTSFSEAELVYLITARFQIFRSDSHNMYSLLKLEISVFAKAC